ncbi:transposase [Planctomicrobium sp. SH668]|uniref:transposase n=1 Tax=Planctomicrobium sp. SH668 TaxID=3448126 RepID=UPI003F5AF01D
MSATLGHPENSLKTRSQRKTVNEIREALSVCTGLLSHSQRLDREFGSCNDKAEAAELLAKAATSSQPKPLFADAGYDAERVHRFCREDWQVDSVIKPTVHRTDGGLNGMYRSEMTAENLKDKGYGRRWLVESYMSANKRTTGTTLSSRHERSLFVEAGLRVLAYTLRR